MNPMNAALLHEASARRVAKAVGELCFEGLLEPRALEGEAFVIELSDALHWRVRARASAWGGLHVEPGSVLRCVVGEPPRPLDTLGQLVLDARARLGASDETLAAWLDELDASVLAEAGQLERLADHDAASLAALDGVALEQLLDGHPKLIANRGRIGWGLAELRDYAPEFGAALQLDWLIVAPALARTSGLADAPARPLLDACCDADERARLLAQVERMAAPLAERGVLVPVHPWQWRRHLAARHADALARGELAWLGRFGDRYAPRLSTRTLSNLDRPHCDDIKLALTILNTSCWRGLPGAHVEQGVALAAALAGVVEGDARLREAGVRVLVDRGGVHVPDARLAPLEQVPYRLREQCGAIWRTSAALRLRAGEREITAAALHQCDRAGEPLIRHYVEHSGVSLAAWLDALFACTALPLDRLLCVHGLGVIAHGQNLGVILREGVPVGMLLRDVHGDLRRDREGAHEGALAQLPALPREQLLHDLYTGYFASVLRFVAPLLERSFGLRETALLGQLASALARGRESIGEASLGFDLFAPTMPRICLNRARLRGEHGEGRVRDLPLLGPPLRNPLAGHAWREGS